MRWGRVGRLWHYANVFMGSSYWHLPQGLGVRAASQQLDGYYIDLRKKVQWKGARDKRGLPLNQIYSRQNFPTTVIQYGLGHYDLWLETGRSEHEVSAVAAADWLVAVQDRHGGWAVHFDYPPYRLKAPWYSAMIQGQGISLLARISLQQRERRYVEAARRALELLLRPVSGGGTARFVAGDVYLEEYPSPSPSLVLNGWSFALFGLWDLYLLTGEKSAEAFFRRSIATLRAKLPCYDTGFWSRYDLAGRLASPFYHDLHISQMHALTLITGSAEFADYARRWERQRSNRRCRWLALGVKSLEKLREIALQPS